jgi:hypothetical protein
VTRRNWITLYWFTLFRRLGGNLSGFRFKFRSLIITKAAQAPKLTHPTSDNRTPTRNSSSLVCGEGSSSQNREQFTLARGGTPGKPLELGSTKSAGTSTYFSSWVSHDSRLG